MKKPWEWTPLRVLIAIPVIVVIVIWENVAALFGRKP